jgi:hypothetical protein
MTDKPELIRSFSQKLAVDGFCHQAITRFDRWSMSAMAMLRQLGSQMLG